MGVYVDRLGEELASNCPPTLYEGQDVLVVIPDDTRALPLAAVLPLVFAQLAGAARVRVLVGLGLHRPMSGPSWTAVKRAASGAEAIAQHDPDQAVARAVNVLDVQVRLHPWVLAADRVVCVSRVEPHQYAGFSGGAKAVAIGCAGRATIGALHGLKLLRNPTTRLGQIRPNAFRAALDAAVLGLTLDGVQLVPSGQGFTGFAGRLEDAFERAVAHAYDRVFVPVESLLDWIHLPVPAAKGESFYQASRAATYVALSDRSPIRPGGWLLVEAPCPEGLGAGAGEQAFAEALRRGPETLRRELEGTKRVKGFSGGVQRAYVLVQALDRAQIGVIGASSISTLEPFGVRFFPDLSQARAELGLGNVGLTWTDVFSSLPTLIDL